MTAALAALLLVVSSSGARAELAGDANCDGAVDQTDLRPLLEALFAGASCAGADANLDARLGSADVVAYASILAAVAEVTHTPTLAPTVTRTPSVGPSATLTRSGTNTGTPSPSRTPSAGASATATRSGAATRTPTRLPTATRSPSQTRTFTRTATLRPSATPTRTPTAKSTATSTRTAGATRTRTRTALPASTSTQTSTRVPTRTITPTNTRVSTFTPTAPPTRTSTRMRTPTIDLPAGPYITYFGIARADGRPDEPIGTNGEGVPIYNRVVASGFLVIVEARRGRTPVAVGTSRFDSDPNDPSVRPDLQILSNRPLGNGSAAVCDRGIGEGEPIGGVPGVNPVSFDFTQPISDALNDFGCRFDFHISSDDACTKNALGNFAFVSTQTQTQFCSVPAIGVELLFPSGDTELVVQVRNVNGTLGNQRRLIVRAP